MFNIYDGSFGYVIFDKDEGTKGLSYMPGDSQGTSEEWCHGAKI